MKDSVELGDQAALEEEKQQKKKMKKKKKRKDKENKEEKKPENSEEKASKTEPQSHSEEKKAKKRKKGKAKGSEDEVQVDKKKQENQGDESGAAKDKAPKRKKRKSDDIKDEKKKIDGPKIYFCVDCKTPMNIGTKESHLQGKRHAKAALRNNGNKKTFFIGQIDLSASENDIKAHFADVCSRPYSIRLLRDRDTNQSRGMAFITVHTDDKDPCLGLNRTLLLGKRINIEESMDGSATEHRKQELKRIKMEHDSSHSKDLLALIDELDKDRKSNFRRTDVDEDVFEFLKTISFEVAKTALQQFGETDLKKAKNRSAYLMSMIKRNVQGGKLECFVCGDHGHLKKNCPTIRRHR